MTKIEELELELKARKIVDGTELDWRECIRLAINSKPWAGDLSDYRVEELEFALGILEGKPVWADSRVFAHGIPVRIKQSLGDRFALVDGSRIDKEVLSWGPPTPKTVNFRERLTANAEDFDSIISLILAENAALRKALEEIK